MKAVTQTEKQLTPTENNDIRHVAAGNLAFLLSVIRCGESLSPIEEANVRRIIDALEEDAAAAQYSDEWMRRSMQDQYERGLADAVDTNDPEVDVGQNTAPCRFTYTRVTLCGRGKREHNNDALGHPFIAEMGEAAKRSEHDDGTCERAANGQGSHASLCGCVCHSTPTQDELDGWIKLCGELLGAQQRARSRVTQPPIAAEQIAKQIITWLYGRELALSDQDREGIRSELVQRVLRLLASSTAVDPAEMTGSYAKVFAGTCAIGYADCSLVEFAQGLKYFIEAESQKPNGDTHLINTLRRAACVGWELARRGPELINRTVDPASLSAKDKRRLRAAVKRGIKKWEELADLRYTDEGIEFIVAEIEHGLSRGEAGK